MQSLFICLVVHLTLAGGARGQETAPNTTASSGSGSSQEPEDDFGQFDDSVPYCFRFTWLGPDYEKNTPFDSNCKEILKDNKERNIPCRQPLVITDNSTSPDMDYLFKHHRDRVLCRRSKAQSCVKFSYFFNDQLLNVTYMCAKVLSVGEGAITSGCWGQQDSGYQTQVCVCQSTPGNFKPCNSANNNRLSLPLLLLYIALRLSNKILS